MHRHLLAVCAAILPLSLVFSPANAKLLADRNCWQADELSAAEVHNFQTMLMVGALKCRDRVPAALEGYNAFMNAKRDLIVANQYVLMSHFIREYGDSSGIGAFRDYETKIGNRHSGADNLARCEAIGAMSRMAAHASEADLRELARVIGEESLAATCPDLASADDGLAPTVAAAAPEDELPAAPATELATAAPVSAPAAVEAKADDGASVPVTNSSGTQPKVVTVAEPATPAAEPAAAEPAVVSPAPAQPTAAQALQDAARALALAATALQTEAAPPASAPAPKTAELTTAPN